MRKHRLLEHVPQGPSLFWQRSGTQAFPHLDLVSLLRNLHFSLMFENTKIVKTYSRLHRACRRRWLPTYQAKHFPSPPNMELTSRWAGPFINQGLLKIQGMLQVLAMS